MSVTEIALCEVPYLVLRPNQTYKFVIREGCADCQKAAAADCLWMRTLEDKP